MKVCSKCGRELDENMFTKDKTTKDGLRSSCKDCLKAYKKQNRDKHIAYMKEYNSNNREKHNENSKNYYHDNKDILYEKDKLKKETDILYKINCNIHKCINNVLTGRSNTTMYTKYLGYTEKQLKEHLEKQFTPEMNWFNYGLTWELDHIIPKSYFHFNSVEDKEFRICWSLMNIRPILVSTNRQRPKDGSDISEELKQRIQGQII